jgi:imidazoleglycerol-phosphate dehydratase
MTKKRSAVIKRKTREVDISGKIVIDGQGKSKINSGFKSLDHMLELMAFHGIFDLLLQAKGDLAHHIVEDIGIALGDGFKKAIGKAAGIRRYGHTSVPMDEVLASVAVDISGRPRLVFVIGGSSTWKDSLDLSADDFKTFLEAFVEHAKVSLNINLNAGNLDAHHAFEAIFKALGIALDMAAQIDPRRKGIPSTKGVID